MLVSLVWRLVNNLIHQGTGPIFQAQNDLTLLVEAVEISEESLGKAYTFVRRRGEGFEHTEYVRHEDGSSGFLADGYYTIFECHPEAWRHALDRLAEIGFVEIREARQRGIISPDWEPTPETSTLAACGSPAVVEPDQPPAASQGNVFPAFDEFPQA